MGGASYSYVELENDYGKFYGTASSDGGGFSGVGTTDFSQETWKNEIISDLSGYDGFVINVASEDARTFKFDLSDDRWRFFRCSWDAFYEVPGGMEQTTIYVPFHSFQPRVIGFSVWWNEWIPF